MHSFWGKCRKSNLGFTGVIICWTWQQDHCSRWRSTPSPPPSQVWVPWSASCTGNPLSHSCNLKNGPLWAFEGDALWHWTGGIGIILLHTLVIVVKQYPFLPVAIFKVAHGAAVSLVFSCVLPFSCSMNFICVSPWMWLTLGSFLHSYYVSERLLTLALCLAGLLLLEHVWYTQVFMCLWWRYLIEWYGDAFGLKVENLPENNAMDAFAEALALAWKEFGDTR